MDVFAFVIHLLLLILCISHTACFTGEDYVTCYKGVNFGDVDFLISILKRILNKILACSSNSTIKCYAASEIQSNLFILLDFRSQTIVT